MQPYAFDALEPHIDEATMKVHHGGHHQGESRPSFDSATITWLAISCSTVCASRSALASAAYTDKLNGGIDTLKGSQPDLAALPIDRLLQSLDAIADPKLRGLIRNHGGGFLNHAHFWKWMAPAGAGGGGAPTGEVASAIEGAFGSLDKFKEEFSNAAAVRGGAAAGAGDCCWSSCAVMLLPPG